MTSTYVIDNWSISKDFIKVVWLREKNNKISILFSISTATDLAIDYLQTQCQS